jgi:hypothetical protein
MRVVDGLVENLLRLLFGGPKAFDSTGELTNEQRQELIRQEGLKMRLRDIDREAAIIMRQPSDGAGR